MTQSFQEYVSRIRELKRRRQLHSKVEERLAALLLQLFPDSACVGEVCGVLGGRNDLMQFFFSGRRIVFELFCSPSQVPQDLRLLEQSTADVKIAILLDPQIDDALSKEYFRKKPEAFQFLWLRELMMDDLEAACLAHLRELIDESSAIIRLRRLLALPCGEQIEDLVNKQLLSLEVAVSASAPESESTDKPTGRQVLALLVIATLRSLGIRTEKLRTLYAWLESSIHFALEIVSCGLQAFLISDLNGQHAIWSDGDLADDLIVGAEFQARPAVCLCLNKIVNDYREALGFRAIPARLHFYHTYIEYIDKLHSVWEREDGIEELNRRLARNTTPDVMP